MNEFLHISDLPNIITFFNDVNADMGNQQIWMIVIGACLLLAIHAVAVLGIASAFHGIDAVMTRRKIIAASFLSYFIAILLVISIHFAEIIVWAYICLAWKVFNTNAQALFFAGEMYTTVGFGSYKLAEQWRILPIIIAFTGIFAVSMSGAALYNMMGALIGPGNKGSGS